MEKEKKKEEERRDVARMLQLAIAAVLTIAGIALLVAGFWVPPTGEISASVLTAYGMTLTFVGTLLGVDYHYRTVIDRVRKEGGDK